MNDQNLLGVLSSSGAIKIALQVMEPSFNDETGSGEFGFIASRLDGCSFNGLDFTFPLGHIASVIAREFAGRDQGKKDGGRVNVGFGVLLR